MLTNWVSNSKGLLSLTSSGLIWLYNLIFAGIWKHPFWLPIIMMTMVSRKYVTFWLWNLTFHPYCVIYCNLPFNIFTATVVETFCCNIDFASAITTLPKLPSPRLLPTIRFSLGNSQSTSNGNSYSDMQREPDLVLEAFCFSIFTIGTFCKFYINDMKEINLLIKK